MTTRDLGDVVVRARGLARHLLRSDELRRLARTAGSGALAAALADLGYWPAPSAGGGPLPAATLVERSIEHETSKRLAVLVRWLDDRAARFAPLFDVELRDALRIRLRELADADAQTPPSALALRGGWPALRELRARLARASDPADLVRTLRGAKSGWAEPLHDARTRHGDDRRALERALDRAWAERALGALGRRRGPVRCWVEDEIDLHNAWEALLSGGGAFLAGGRRFDATQWTRVHAEPDEVTRRRSLAAALRGGPLAAAFADPTVGLDALEAKTASARIMAAHRAGRVDPTGEAPILEVVLRLRAERADLRCIAWGVAVGLPVETIVSRLGIAA